MHIFQLIICEILSLATAMVILEPEMNISDVSIGKFKFKNKIINMFV